PASRVARGEDEFAGSRTPPDAAQGQSARSHGAPKPVVRGHRLAIGWPAELCWSAVTELACSKREMGPDRRPGAVASVFNLKIVPPKPCTTWTPDTAKRGQVRRLEREVFDE